MTISKSKIAIVGMACRFPGATNYHEYWQNLKNAKGSISEVPQDRWSWQDYWGDPKKEKNKTNIKWGGFIKDIDKFDSLFFKISPRESNFIDPQHRLFLEAVWHAVEDSGYAMHQLSGKKVGVYAGVSKNDYTELMRQDNAEIASYISTGTVHSILVNRISYLFNFRGKSEPVDTACSSSLVALHNAIRDIQCGEIDFGLVGGVNLLLSPTIFISHAKSGMLSPEGKCKTFDASADGYVRGEGVGVIAIKKLEKAISDGDHIHAVVAGSAINHGGRGMFLTSPNVNAQAECITSALQDAGISSNSVSYIEAHGTGTELGDPIEYNALKKSFSENADGPLKKHCFIGSVKSNIGHLEAAAGMAGIIKLILAMQNELIPRTLNFNTLNPLIKTDDSPFHIAEKETPWESDKSSKPVYAGVSSFGMGGVNAHVILEKYSARNLAPMAPEQSNNGPAFLFVFSAKKDRLPDLLKAYIDYFSNNLDLPLLNVSYTLLYGREWLEEKIAVIAANQDELISAMKRLLDKKNELIICADKDRESSDIWKSIGEKWIKGKDIDLLEHVFQSAKKVPLPGYPFKKTRHWYPVDKVHKKGSMSGNFNENKKSITKTSSLEITEKNFTSALDVSSYINILENHKVKNNPILPGVAYLNIVYSHSIDLLKSVQSCKFKNIYWLQSISEANNPNISIQSKNKNLKFDFSEGKSLFCSGDMDFSSGYLKSVNTLNIDNKKSAEKVNKSLLYQSFRKYGLNYGQEFQVLEWVEVGIKKAKSSYLVRENLSVSGLNLDPAILDGCMQTVVALSIFGLKRSERQEVPFHLKSLSIYQPIPNEGTIYATLVEETDRSSVFNMVLVGKDGSTVAEFDNLIKKVLPDSIAKKIIPSVNKLYHYEPFWKKDPLGIVGSEMSRPVERDNYLHGVFVNKKLTRISDLKKGYLYLYTKDYFFEANFIGSHDQIYMFEGQESYQSVIEQFFSASFIENIVFFVEEKSVSDSELYYDQNVHQALDLLAIVQAVIKSRKYKKLSVLSVCAENSLYGAMHAGFYRTLQYENPSILGAVVFSSGYLNDELIISELENIGQRNGKAVPLNELKYQRDGRYVKQMRQCDFNEIRSGDVKPKSVFFISGGAGGIAYKVSKYLAKNNQANIVWVGRSPVSDSILNKEKNINELGGCAIYCQADVSDLNSLQVAWQRANAEFGKVDYIIHAAGLIDDSYILLKEPDSFLKVVQPKILGALNLDLVSKSASIKQFVVFSSIASLMPNQGQVDYACANSFLDNFSVWRNELSKNGQRQGRTLSINWPLWADGGMGVTSSEELHLLKVFGMKPMSSDVGLDAFWGLVKNNIGERHNEQVLLIEGDKQKIDTQLGVVNMDETINFESKSIDRETINSYLVDVFSKNIDGVDKAKIKADEMISEYRIDSMSIHKIIIEINQYFEITVDATVFFEISTIAELSEIVRASLDGQGIPNFSHKDKANNWSLIDVNKTDWKNLIFTRTFSVKEFYLEDHVVDGQYNMPGACYIEMARQACEVALQGKGYVDALEGNYWVKKLSSPGNDFDAHIQLVSGNDGVYSYEIYSIDAAGDRHKHAIGRARTKSSKPSVHDSIDIESIKMRSQSKWLPERIYESIVGEGLHVRNTFMPMQFIHLSENEALAMLQLPDTVLETHGDYLLHPTTLTGVFQTALICNRQTDFSRNRFIPIAIDKIQVFNVINKRCFVYCKSASPNRESAEVRKYDLDVCDESGVVLASLRGFSIRKLAPDLSQSHQISSPKREDGSTLVVVSDWLKNQLEQPVGMPASDMDGETNFENYGINSIMVVELNSTLERFFDNLSKTLFFEYRNIDELANYFIENYFENLLDVIPSLNKTQPVKSSESQEGGKPDINVAADDGNRHLLIEKSIAALLSRPLGMPVSDIESDVSFENYGISSIMVVELNECLDQYFDSLSKTLFFEYRSIKELSKYLYSEQQENTETLVKTVLDKDITASTKVQMNEPERSVRVQPGLEQDLGAEVTKKSVSLTPEDEGIAIIGMAGRYGSTDDVEQFWNLLLEGCDDIREIPDSRFDYKSLYDPDPEQNKIYAKWGSFINDIDKFDPIMFGISPREAELIDPQERIMLEVAWQGLMDAGYSARRLKQYKNSTAVYIGALWQPYQAIAADAVNRGQAVAPSSLLYSIANRISFSFDLKGPSMAIDTACSASMSALHLACQSLRLGESDMAIVGGVNVSLHSQKYLFLSQNRFLSTNGQCRSFGAEGDGYVPGEGVGCIILKPLSLAKRDGDQILATVIGSAVNHGGHTNGYTVPDPNAQASVIKRSLAQSKIDPQSISYIEAHGTGTSLGDPIEISGLRKSFDANTSSRSTPCKIGSVKSNIGHLEAAAGIAGITKVVLQMKNKMLVPSLHSEHLNPNIDFNDGFFEVQQQVQPWGEDGRPLRATVSSFGAGGSNANVIIESYENSDVAVQYQPISYVAIPCSARDENQLKSYLYLINDFIVKNAYLKLRDIAYTMQLGRDSLSARVVFIVNSVQGLATAVDDYLNERENDSILTLVKDFPKEIPSTASHETAFSWLKQKDDWPEEHATQGKITSLPPLPLNRRRYWLDAGLGNTVTAEMVNKPTKKIPVESKAQSQDFDNVSSDVSQPVMQWVESELPPVNSKLNGLIFVNGNSNLSEKVKRQTNLTSHKNLLCLCSGVGFEKTEWGYDIGFSDKEQLKRLALVLREPPWDSTPVVIIQDEGFDMTDFVETVLTDCGDKDIHLLQSSATMDLSNNVSALKKHSINNGRVYSIQLTKEDIEGVFFGKIIEQEITYKEKYLARVKYINGSRHVENGLPEYNDSKKYGSDKDDFDVLKIINAMENSDFDIDSIIDSISVEMT